VDVGVGRAPGCGGGGPVGSGLPYDAASVVRVGGGRSGFCCSGCDSESLDGGWRGASLKIRIGGMMTDIG